MGPWWRVDLQQPYRISAVVISNRGDCCWERLRGAEIYVGNSLEKNGTINPRCASISKVERGSTETICCKGMTGRYVTIAIPNRKEYLTLCEVEVYGVPVVNRCKGNQNGTQANVALKGLATQSSLGDWRGVPEHAIDGNKNSVYGSLSCIHTRFEMGPWWRVDLQQPYRIFAVAITNRGDCCWERLRGAELHIGNSLEKNGTLNPRCASISIVERGSTDSFCCNGMVGRYVTIAIPTRVEYLTLCEVEVYGIPDVNQCPGNQNDSYCCNQLVGRYVTIAIPTREEYLTLCEVEVYGGLVGSACLRKPLRTNVALKGTAVQSSLCDQGVPEHAIDGNRNSVYGSLSCTHTQYEMNPWWRVDLQQPHKISVVLITNRGDCCWERLKGAEIHIGNSLEKNGTLTHRCASVSEVERGSTEAFCCGELEGRYVTITIPGREEYLTLCEVEVYGVPSICS
nr:PREDICTED: uncharacterized protein LOC102353115 [Latimeria chalumnae]|eukprot:XP_014344319.1 PREDICTED: uncharacterized protein LOC102353115 [Latimeria chalumnae]